MPIKLEFGGIELTGDVESQPRQAARTEPGSVRIGVIADLRGRGQSGMAEPAQTLAARRIIRVDRDNLDEVLGRLQVELRLALPGGESTPIVLSFRELEDFHPDRILAHAEVFAALSATRARLENPATFAEADADLTASPRKISPVPSPLAVSPPEESASPADLLDQILQQSSSTTAAAPVSPRQTGAWGAFLEQITAPHIRRENPRQAELIKGIDAAMAQLLRDILHHPAFQSLESLWRSLHLLTRRLDTGAELTLELIDATRAELDADLLSARAIDTTATYKLLIESSVGIEGGRPWTFLVTDLIFGPSGHEIGLLWRLGQVARLAGAPLIAAASSQLVGCESLASAPDPDDWATPTTGKYWSDLRHSAEAPYLGLALPRFLVRAPYGPETSPIEAIAFEELTTPTAHEAYLWGNPAFALAALLGASFNAAGRFDHRRLSADLTDLPLCIERTDDGESRAKPCAEVLLGTRAADRLLEAGLMPFQSIRDRDAIRLAGLTSIADPPAPLQIR